MARRPPRCLCSEIIILFYHYLLASTMMIMCSSYSIRSIAPRHNIIHGGPSATVRGVGAALSVQRSGRPLHTTTTMATATTTKHNSSCSTTATTLLLEPVVVICGPSGTGKGTIIDRLIALHPTKLGLSVSHTTRPPRPNEMDGVHYNFVTKNDLEMELASNGKQDFIEHARVHGNIYGTSKQAVRRVQDAMKVCILDIDVEGVKQVKLSGVPAKYLFITPPSLEVLELRLRGRNTETDDQILLRLQNAKAELDFGSPLNKHFDATVTNDALNVAVEEVVRAIHNWFPDKGFL